MIAASKSWGSILWPIETASFLTYSSARAILSRSNYTEFFCYNLYHFVLVYVVQEWATTMEGNKNPFLAAPIREVLE